VNVTKDLRHKLDFVKHIVGEETTAAIAKALQSSSPQDPWASFLATKRSILLRAGAPPVMKR
jgi:hypothetical protein